MFDGENSPWFSGDDGFPDADHPGVISIEAMRDNALMLFGRLMAQTTGLKSDYVAEDVSDAQREFLSIAETENIIRSFSAHDNGEMMAVGGNSRQEARTQVRKLMEALVTRIMSNVTAEASRRDLIDVAFDSEADAFAFNVNDNGKSLIETYKDMFDDNV